MYSPNNDPTDANAISYNIMWPISDIKANEAIYRDYLFGFSEAAFRSARLHSWFNTPESFYKEALHALRKKEQVVDVEKEHSRIQENYPLRGSLNQEKVKVFTENREQMASLTDTRFEFTYFEQAEVFWLLGLDR